MNTASRMESLCKEFGFDAVPSANLTAQPDGTVPLRPLGEATVKGKREPITVFTLA